MRLNRPKETNTPKLRNTSKPPKKRMFRLAISERVAFPSAQIEAAKPKVKTAMRAMRSGFSSSEYSAGSCLAVVINQTYPTPYAGNKSPSKNSQFMVNPFRKSLVTGISKLNRLGLAASMQRRRAFHAGPRFPVKHQPPEHPFNVQVGRLFKALVCQFDGFLEQFFTKLIVHDEIVVMKCQGRYS